MLMESLCEALCSCGFEYSRAQADAIAAMANAPKAKLTSLTELTQT
jgi:hypothetical protein